MSWRKTCLQLGCRSIIDVVVIVIGVVVIVFDCIIVVVAVAVVIDVNIAVVVIDVIIVVVVDVDVVMTKIVESPNRPVRSTFQNLIKNASGVCVRERESVVCAFVHLCVREWVCECVCVLERERERGREDICPAKRDRAKK